jgi:glutamine synthetase
MGCYTQTEVQQFIQENDVRFVRLAFCDILGNQKNISILADEIPRAFEHGISFDASAVAGFTDICNSDLLLFPDASTITILPWRPMDGRVARMFCNIKHPDGRSFERDSRTLLREKMLEAFSEGYDIKIGAESEFYLFKMNEDGEATEEPIDSGGYFDITPKDKGENIRREICLTLNEMGIKPVSSHHERGPGQNEIVFRYSDALRAADNFTSYKVVVRTMAARDGLVASFLPKPLR